MHVPVPTVCWPEALRTAHSWDRGEVCREHDAWHDDDGLGNGCSRQLRHAEQPDTHRHTNSDYLMQAPRTPCLLIIYIFSPRQKVKMYALNTLAAHWMVMESSWRKGRRSLWDRRNSLSIKPIRDVSRI